MFHSCACKNGYVEGEQQKKIAGEKRKVNHICIIKLVASNNIYSSVEKKYYNKAEYSNGLFIGDRSAVRDDYGDILTNKHSVTFTGSSFMTPY